MCFVAADTSVPQYLIIGKGDAVSHGGRLIRALYFQTQGGAREVHIRLRFVQQQRTTTMCTVVADTSHFRLLRGTRTLSLELTVELRGTCTLSLNR